MRRSYLIGAFSLLLALVTSCTRDGGDPTATGSIMQRPAVTGTQASTRTATVVRQATATTPATSTSTSLPSPTALPTSAPSATYDPAVRNEILFDGLASGDQYLLRFFAIDADGSDLHPLTNGVDDFEGNPTLSPDERRMALIRGSGGVYVVEIATRKEHFIVPGRATISWSPDGTRLALGWQEHSTGSACCGGGRQFEDPPKIAVVAADGTNLWILSASTFTDTDGWIIDQAPVWSPDGSHILFIRWYSQSISQDEPIAQGAVGWSVLVVANADGTELHEVDTGDVEPVWDARWSPDGITVLFAGRSRGVFDEPTGLYTVAVDGSGLTRLTPPELSVDHSFEYSPDGWSILFHGWQTVGSGARGLYQMAADGSSLKRMLKSEADIVIGQFAFSPDGSHIALGVFHTNTGAGSLIVVNADGSEAVSFAVVPMSRTLAWSPEGTRLALVTAPEASGWLVLRIIDLRTGAVSHPLAEVGIAEAGGGYVFWPDHN